MSKHNIIITVAIIIVGGLWYACWPELLFVKISELSYDSNPAAGVRAETEELVKIVYEEGTERILGAQVIGAHAEDIVQIAAVAIKGGLKKSEVGAMHYVFPTIGGAIFDTMAS